jgi:hypothetical protein
MLKQEDSSMPLFIQDFPRLHHLCFNGVAFQNIDLMARYLASCPLLRSFKLDTCHFHNVDLWKEYSLAPIQELDLPLTSHLPHILSWASHSGLASSLRRLKVLTWKEGDHEALVAFVSTPGLHLSGLILAIELIDWQPSGML